MPEEEVSESGNQDHFKEKVLEQDHDQTRQNCFNSRLQNSPRVACGPCVLLKNSTVSLQPQRINTCHHMCSPTWKQCSIAASDQAEAALAFDSESNWNENRALEKSRPSNEVNGQFAHVVERDKIWALDAEGKVHELSCIQDQQGKMLHTRESLGHYWYRQILYNVNGCIKKIESYIPPHSIRARKAVATENLVPNLYDNPWEAFLFMKNYAEPQAAVERVDANDMEETHHEGREVPSKRRIRYQSMKSSKTQQSCIGNRVLNNGVRKQPWSTSIKQLERRRPICHFTSLDVELLVRAVEKFGTGRWRDIKENYFSLEKHRSAADLKDKWRSLLHSAKLAPEQRRCVKLASVLVKRILAIDEEEKSRQVT